MLLHKEAILHEELNMSKRVLYYIHLISELRGQDDAAEQRLPRHRGQLVEGPVRRGIQRGGRYGNITLLSWIKPLNACDIRM